MTETLIAGLHPAAFPANFRFLPNPALRPEVGKNKEIGVNLRYDNIALPGDAFRGKFNVYRNDLTDFIELTVVAARRVCAPPSPFCFQYRNIPSARIEGWEFDTNYDAGSFFLGFAGSHVRGRNLITGVPLLKIPPDQYATTVGARFLDRKLTVAVRWLAVNAKLRAGHPEQRGDHRQSGPARRRAPTISSISMPAISPRRTSPGRCRSKICSTCNTLPI